MKARGWRKIAAATRGIPTTRRWSCPRAVVFRTELPKTRLGKIDFVELTRD